MYALSRGQSFLRVRSRPSNLQIWAAKHGPFGLEKHDHQLELEHEFDHDSQPATIDRPVASFDSTLEIFPMVILRERECVYVGST